MLVEEPHAVKNQAQTLYLVPVLVPTELQVDHDGRGKGRSSKLVYTHRTTRATPEVMIETLQYLPSFYVFAATYNQLQSYPHLSVLPMKLVLSAISW